MKRLIPLILNILLPFLVTTQLWAGSQGMATSDKEMSLLFVQSADTSTLTPVKDQPGTYTLVLTNVEPYVDYFSQRPKRVSGLMSMADFIKNWYAKTNDSFAKDAPNAMLRVVSDNKKHLSFAVELINPVYDKKTKTVTYTARQLPGKRQHTLPSAETTFGFTGLFIDNAAVCPGCIVH